MYSAWSVRSRGRDGLELGGEALDRLTRSEPRDDLDVVLIPVRHVLGRPLFRHPEFGLRRGETEARRHDTDDDARLAIDGDRLPDRRPIFAVETLPGRVRQHDGRRRRRRVIVRCERPAEQRLDSQHAEDVADRRDRLKRLRLPGPDHRGERRREPCHVTRRARVATEVDEVRRRRAVHRRRLRGGVAHDGHDSARVADRERPQQHTVHHGEDRRVGADAYRQRRHGDRGE